MSASSELVEMTIAALKIAPGDWTFTRFEATNEKLDVVVWIANGFYGLKIRGPGVSTSEEPAHFTGWLTPWRRRVMAAVRKAAVLDLRKRFAAAYPDALPPKPVGEGVGP